MNYALICNYFMVTKQIKYDAWRILIVKTDIGTNCTENWNASENSIKPVVRTKVVPGTHAV